MNICTGTFLRASTCRNRRFIVPPGAAPSEKNGVGGRHSHACRGRLHFPRLGPPPTSPRSVCAPFRLFDRFLFSPFLFCRSIFLADRLCFLVCVFLSVFFLSFFSVFLSLFSCLLLHAQCGIAVHDPHSTHTTHTLHTTLHSNRDDDRHNL